MTQEGCQPGQGSANSTTAPGSSLCQNVFRWHFTLAATVSGKGSTLGKGKRSWGGGGEGLPPLPKKTLLGACQAAEAERGASRSNSFSVAFVSPRPEGEAGARSRLIPAAAAAAWAPDGLSILPAVPAEQGLRAEPSGWLRAASRRSGIHSHPALPLSRGAGPCLPPPFPEAPGGPTCGT